MTAKKDRLAVGRRLAVCAAAALALGAPADAAPPSADGGAYASPDTPGPRLTVSQSELRESLTCSGDLANTSREPVLFVPGALLFPEEHYGWNYHRAFDALGWPYCSTALPGYSLGDMQVDGEYVVYAIRTMYQRSGRRIALLGGGKGGALPRWALRFWPDTRAMVDDHIGLVPLNHGAEGVALLCLPDSARTMTATPLPSTTGCAPTLWQAIPGSKFVRAMNSYQETFPGISYTEVTSHQALFTPARYAYLNGGGGRITNVAVQDVCPGHIADHDRVGAYDPVGYALAIDALTHDGPAAPARIDRSVCSQSFAPGVDPATFPVDFAKFQATWFRFATAKRVSEEPALRCYATATCPPDHP